MWISIIRYLSALGYTVSIADTYNRNISSCIHYLVGYFYKINNHIVVIIPVYQKKISVFLWTYAIMTILNNYYNFTKILPSYESSMLEQLEILILGQEADYRLVAWEYVRCLKESSSLNFNHKWAYQLPTKHTAHSNWTLSCRQNSSY